MRKIQLLTAIALAALMAACAQTNETAQGNCDQLPSEAFLQAVDQGKCDLDVTTAAGGEPNQPNKHESDNDHSERDESDGDGDGGGNPDPDPDPDPEDGGNHPSTQPETDHL
ncbi:hypothetical protein [Dongia sp.]|uniref:hypothetical protein n=1 Tax=Dongia sp. TaxID=1977262 RepID=UPI0035AF3FC7